MGWLLIAMGVLVVSGLLALIVSASPRLSTVLGAAGAVVGCGIGLAAVLSILWGDQERSLHWNWDVPYGSFSVELDALSAFFSFPVLVLSGLGAIYASRYVVAFWGHRRLGGLWFFYNLLVASMLLVVLARNGI